MHNVRGEYCVVNDVMGCLWNTKTGIVNFTRNGELIQDLNSREIISVLRDRNQFYLYPSITTSHGDNVHYCVNIGEDVVNHPFKYSKFNVFSIGNCWNELLNHQFTDVIFK
jgi:hypothetical protein